MSVNTSWSGTRRSFPPRVAKLILKRANYHCQIQYDCCIGTATEADHIICVAEWPEGQSGCGDPSNGQAGCTPCHARKTKAEAARGRARKPSRFRTPAPHPGLKNA